MRQHAREQRSGLPAEQHRTKVEDDLHASKRASKPAVEASSP